MASRQRSSVGRAAAAQPIVEQLPAAVELPPLQKLSIQGQGYGEASRRHSLAHDSSAGAGPSAPEAAQQGPLGQGLLGRAEGSESADKESHVYLHGSGAASVEMRQTSGKNCSPFTCILR